jgi:hypothetical protein
MAASNTRFTQNSLGQSKTPIDSDHGIYRDLRNVGANYPFARSHRFAGIQPNSAHRDYSRLSCGIHLVSSRHPYIKARPLRSRSVLPIRWDVGN